MTFLQKCFSVSLILLTFNSSVFADTQATASVSENQVSLGDVFTLIVEVDDTGSEYQLDTSKLKDNFTVFLPSKSEKRSYVNGSFKAQTIWNVTLQSTKIGTFTIPALKVGNVSTKPIKIKVQKAGTQQLPTKSDVIFIENTVNESSIFVGQQVILNSKIYVSENITNANIHHPQLESAEIEKLDANSQTQTIRNGIRYQIFSSQYKITPSVTGDKIIKSPLLTGEINKSSNQNRYQIVSQPINIKGNDVPLNVKAIPKHFKGEWLVSDDVRLKENNDLQEKEHFVGEPITRSISLQVASISVDEMPEIKLNYDKSLRYYPDKDDLKQGEINNKVYSQRTITHAIIANKSGKLTLPEITVPWWNITTNQQEYAKLPAQTLTIKPALTANTTLTTPVTPSEVIKAEQNTNNHVNGDGNTKNGTTQLIIWQVATFVLLLLLILLTIYHLYHRKHTEVETTVNEAPNNSLAFKVLMTALQAANANEVYSSLLRYFQSQYPTLTQLQEVGRFTQLEGEKKASLMHNLLQLELACSGQENEWDSSALQKLITLHHQSPESTQQDSLAKINP